MKRITFLVLMFFTGITSAGTVLEKLKNTPASQYQVGIFQLELGAFILEQKMMDKRIKGTSFKFNDISVVEDEKSVYLKFSAVGKTKDVTQEQCSLIKDTHSQTFGIGKLARDLWPGLTEQDYKTLEGEFLIKIELISRDNKNFSASC